MKVSWCVSSEEPQVSRRYMGTGDQFYCLVTVIVRSTWAKFFNKTIPLLEGFLGRNETHCFITHRPKSIGLCKVICLPHTRKLENKSLKISFCYVLSQPRCLKTMSPLYQSSVKCLQYCDFFYHVNERGRIHST